ncbi:MAG: mechanosensitive ion channel family protein [Acidobacteriota bacterium]
MVQGLVEPAIVFAVAFAALMAVRQVGLGLIRRRAKGPESNAAVLADAISVPSLLWALAAAISITLHYVTLSPKWAERADQWIGAFIIVSLTLVAMSAAIRMAKLYGERQGMPFAVAGLSRTLIRLVVGSIGVVLLLSNFGRQLTPILTALGVGGIAVALALQDTLANFFAGIHILVERPIFVGDMIRLENGQEGVVSDIGWRTTRVRTGANDTVVIPNTKITSGILLNYSLPAKRSVIEVTVLAGREADAEQVCRIAVEEARRTAGVLEEPAPLCLFDPGVMPTHLQFKLLVNVESRAAAGAVASEVRMRVLKRFRAEGVPLPEIEVRGATPIA